MRNALLLCGALAVSALLPACGNLDPSNGGPLQCDLGTPAAVSANVPRLAPTSTSLSNATDAGPKRYVVELAGDSSSADSSATRVDALSASAPTAPSPQLSPEVNSRTLETIARTGGHVVKPLARNRLVAELNDAQLEQVRTDPAVARVTEDPIRRPLATGPVQKLPWGMSAIGAQEAWSAAAPLTRGAKVCVIDSGLYAGHEDLSPGGGTLSGYPETWNQDACGHGTHVSGTIAALDNDRGVIGANPLGADLFMVRVFGGEDCGWTYGSELADAIDRCVDSGAKVINMSLGGFTPSAPERDALANAWKQGVLVVAAAGNEGDSELEYPASYPSVISVGAIDQDKHVTEFSQKNEQVDLVAPGAGVLSTVPYISRHEVQIGDTTFSGAPMDHSAETEGVSGKLIDGGACTSAGKWSGAIVVCRRGDNTFVEKIANAQQGGAVAAVVYNDRTGDFAGTLGDSPPQLPVVSLAGDEGAALLTHAGQNATLVNEAKRAGSGYATYSGTSMAAPHVSGAASFLMGHATGRSAAEVRTAMLATADDLGTPGVDDESGHGLLRMDKALAALKSGQGIDDATPLAGFLTHCEGTRCSFTDASVPVSGTISSRTWDFGDGTTADGSSGADDTPHTYAQAGTYKVTLTVIDDGGHSATASVPVSTIAASAKGGAVKPGGARDVELDWSGIKTHTVMVVRDGKVIGTSDNSGAVVDALPTGNKRASYRVCSSGGESCSEELVVVPPCAL